MRKFQKYRLVCWLSVILFAIFALIGILARWTAFTVICFAALGIDLIQYAVKNKCPFCKKALRVCPIKGEEYCPHCGSKIE